MYKRQRLEWSYGQEFDMYNTTLGGKLQGLIEMRDGNNAENFKATLTGLQKNDKMCIRDSCKDISDSVLSV